MFLDWIFLVRIPNFIARCILVTHTLARSLAHSLTMCVAKLWLGEEGNSVQKDAPSVCGRREGADVPARQAQVSETPPEPSIILRYICYLKCNE